MSQLVRFDWAMKYLLRNKANFDVLEGFLSELLHDPELKIEAVLESESNFEAEDDKSNRVDVLAKTHRKEHIIIEVQCYRQWDFLTRILYGTSKTVCEYLQEGDHYKNIVKVISVSIVFFDLGIGEDYLYKGETIFTGMHRGDILGLNEKEQKIYQPIHHIEPKVPRDIFPEYYIIKVPKFRKKIQDKVDEWIYFLKYGEIKQEFSAKGLQSACKKLEFLELSIEEQRAYRRYQDALRDKGSFEDTVEVEKYFAHEQGVKEGRETGEIIKAREIAQRLMKTGMTLEMISEMTGLSLDELRGA